MHPFRIAAALGLTLAATPLAAQRRERPSDYERGYYPWHTPRSEAISASTRGETARANAQAAAEIGDGMYVDETRYARDMRDYYAERREAAQGHARRQRGYAAAMREWYAQADACERGDRRACEAPSPDPADYY